MKQWKVILRIWVLGLLICCCLTAVLVYIAYRIRGHWAIGGEYSLIPLIIVVCTCVTDKRRKHQSSD